MDQIVVVSIALRILRMPSALVDNSVLVILGLYSTATYWPIPFRLIGELISFHLGRIRLITFNWIRRWELFCCIGYRFMIPRIQIYRRPTIFN